MRLQNILRPIIAAVSLSLVKSADLVKHICCAWGIRHAQIQRSVGKSITPCIASFGENTKRSGKRRSVIHLFVYITSVVFILLFASHSFAATITTAGDGNWNSTTPNAPWPGGVVPSATDDVIIRPGDDITVTANATINSVTFSNTAATARTLTVNSGVVLTVAAGVTLQNAANVNTTATVAGAGTINCASFSVGGTVVAPNLTGDGITTLTSTISNLSISGNLTITSVDDGNDDNDAAFNLSSGTVNVGGTVTCNEAGGGADVTLTLASGAQNGTLNLSGATPFNDVSGTLGFTANGTSATVIYSGAAQTVRGSTYTNLTLSGSGSKTTTSVTVNGVISMEGTATASAAPTYGGSATLQYNTSTARTAGIEWITPFVATGGVRIANTGAITMNAAKVFNANAPLTVNSGATLSMSTFLLTLNDDLINNGGTASGTTGGVTITGTATQSIGAFTTTGTVSMTKTGGTATLTGNVSGGGLTINGTGGTLNLGTGLTHTFTGTWVRTSGTLNGGSSTLKIGGIVSGVGGTFTAGTGTVEWNSAGAQTLALVTYYNLTLSGSGTKTFGGSTTISNILSINSSAEAGLPNGTTSNATVLKFNGSLQVTGSWGSNAAISATNKTDTWFFDATTGIINVSNAQTFISSGNFTVPDGVTSITVQAWGGGGRGGARTSGDNVPLAGGGGGAYSSSVLSPVNPGNSYTVTVGAGSTTTAAGGDSWFGSTSTLLAKGGGSVADNSNTRGAGGAASAGVGTTKFNGGNGAAGIGGSYGGGGGSSAGTGTAGNFSNLTTTQQSGATAPTGGGSGGGGATSGNPGTDGTAPGGGGGGGYRATAGSTQPPGDGANGQVIITWIVNTCPTYSLTSTSTNPTTVCSDGTSAITLTGAPANLPDGTYTVKYNLSAPNAATGSTATMTVSGGTGSGTFTTSALANTGTTTLTVTDLTSGTCTNSISANNTSDITVVADPTAPTLNVSTPSSGTTVCVGQDLSATFNAGSGGTGCIDEYQFSTNGGGSYSTYTPGNAISTTGLAGQTVIIQGRRNCSGNGCDGAAETFATLASWTVVADPTAPTLNVATPSSGTTVCEGQNLSATFNAGSGGTGCTDEYQFSTNGGGSYSTYTPGNAISTTGLAGQTVIIQGRRNCSGNGCDGAAETFATLASWTVVADPTAPTLNVATPSNGTTVCVGQDLSATFNAGSGGTGCTDEYQFSTDGGGSYSTYMPGNAIATTGLAGQTVIIQGRRDCVGNGCDGAAETFATLASWTVVADPTAPTLNVATPSSGTTVCVGQDLSATFNAGSGGTGCTDEYQFSTNSGGSYSTYTPGNVISTTGLAGQTVIIQGRRECAGDGCDGAAETFATLASWTVVADPATPTATKSPNVATVCAGQTLTLTGVTDNGGGTGTCNIEYRSSTDNGSNWSSWSTTLPSFAAVAGTNLIEVRKNCDGSGCDLSSTSSYSWTVGASPSVFSITGGGAYCAGGSGVAVGLSSSQSGINYQLKIGGIDTGSPVAGDGNPISFGSQTTAGTYTVVATDAVSSCTSSMTGSAIVTVNPAPVDFNVTGGGAYCAGGSGVTVGLSGSESDMAYQLQIDGADAGTPVTGTGSAISFGNQTVAGTYTVVATNTTTLCTATMNGSVVVTINPLPAAFNVTGGGTYCAGGSGVAVGLDDSESGMNYQLRIGGVDTGSPVAGDGNAISFGNQTAAGTYTVVATNTTTLCTKTMTGSVIVAVNSVTAGIVAGDQNICPGGDPAAFTIIDPATGSATPTYQWYSSTTDCNTGFSDIMGATGATYDPPSGLTVTTYYHRVAKSTLNGVECTATSNCIIVTPQDVTNPTPVCPSIPDVILDGAGSGSLAAYSNTTGPFASTDNCSIMSESYPAQVLNCSNVAGPNTVTLTVKDVNGLTAMTTCAFNVYDGAPPVFVCPPSITVSPTSGTCTYTVSDTEFDPGFVSDNCSIASIKNNRDNTASLAGEVFAANTTTTIEWSVTDVNGLLTACLFTIQVQDCRTISGKLIFQGNGTSGVGSATVTLSGDASDTETTAADGLYTVMASTGSNFTVTPTKSINLTTNNVDVGDATAIEQHLVNLSGSIITNFFRQVAADCDKNNMISTVDAAVIQQALLANPAAVSILTGTGSWRFISSDYAYPNPLATPYALSAFPESRSYSGITSNQTGQDFWGVKVGDVTNGANPANKPSDGASVDAVVWKVQDRLVQAGDTVDATFAVSNFLDIAAYQFALQFDPATLQFDHIEVLTSDIPLSASGNFGLYNIDEGELRAVWGGAQGNTLNDGEKVFKVVLKALSGGQYLSELLQLDSVALPPIAYAPDLTTRELKLEFAKEEVLGTNGVSGASGVQLFQNQPNPFSGRTTIGFLLPEACEAELRILDLNGRVLQSQRGAFAAGRHQAVFEVKDATASGLLYYELITPYGKWTRKMLANGK